MGHKVNVGILPVSKYIYFNYIFKNCCELNLGWDSGFPLTTISFCFDWWTIVTLQVEKKLPGECWLQESHQGCCYGMEKYFRKHGLLTYETWYCGEEYQASCISIHWLPCWTQNTLKGKEVPSSCSDLAMAFQCPLLVKSNIKLLGKGEKSRKSRITKPGKARHGKMDLELRSNK